MRRARHAQRPPQAAGLNEAIHHSPRGATGTSRSIRTATGRSRLTHDSRAAIGNSRITFGPAMRCTAHPKLRFFKCGSLWVIWVIATGVMSSAAFDMWHLQHFPSSFSLGLSSLHSILPRRREKSAENRRSLTVTSRRPGADKSTRLTFRTRFLEIVQHCL